MITYSYTLPEKHPFILETPTAQPKARRLTNTLRACARTTSTYTHHKGSDDSCRHAKLLGHDLGHRCLSSLGLRAGRTAKALEKMDFGVCGSKPSLKA